MYFSEILILTNISVQSAAIFCRFLCFRVEMRNSPLRNVRGGVRVSHVALGHAMPGCSGGPDGDVCRRQRSSRRRRPDPAPLS